MPVIDRNGHFGCVARLVGDNDPLPAVCRSKGKAAVFVKRDRRAVYGDGIHIFLVDRDCLCLAIGLAVLYALDYGACSVQHDTVRANVVRIARLIGQSHIDNVFVIGGNAERCGVRREGHAVKRRLGQLLIGQQIFNRNRLAAVVGGVYRHRLRVLKEQPEGDIVEERFPAVLADFDFARWLFAVFPLGRDGHILGGHGRGNFRLPAHEGVAGFGGSCGGGDGRAVVLRNGCDRAAAVRVKGHGVLVDAPLGRDGHVLGGHGRGNFRLPAHEGIAGLAGSCGGVNCRVVTLGDGVDGAAAVGIKGDGVRIRRPLGCQGHVSRHSGVEVILRIVQIPVRELITLSAGYIRLNSFLARLDDLRGIGSTQSPVSIGHGGGGDVGLRGVGRVVDHIAGIDGLTAELGVLVHGQTAVVGAAGDMALRGDRAVERAAGEVAAEFLPRCAHVPIRVRHGDAAMENTAPDVALAVDIAGKDRGRLPVRVVDGVGGLYGV